MTQKQQEFENLKNEFDSFKRAIDEYDSSKITEQNRLEEFAKVKKINLYVEKFLNIIDIDLIPQEFISGRPAKNTISNTILQLKNNQSSWLTNAISISNGYLRQISIYSSVYIPKKEIPQIIDELIKSYEKTIFQSIENIKTKNLKIDEKSEEFNKFIAEEKEKILKLEELANKLLEQSTNASLASAFQKSKGDFILPISAWTGVFICSIIFFILFAHDGINEIRNFLIENDYKKAVIALAGNLLIYIPLSWLAIFASRRRNENKKLQEEYRYKETIAKSYMGYKEQIEERDNLENELIHNLLDMLKDNPNNKFANSHNKENIPIIEFMDKILDKLEVISNFIKGNK